MTKFQSVESMLQHVWGLTLAKNHPDNPGRRIGGWKTGYTVSGMFPGIGSTHRRFNTLTAVERVMAHSL